MAGSVDSLDTFGGGHLLTLGLGERVLFACETARGRSDEQGEAEDGEYGESGTGQDPPALSRDAFAGRRDTGPGDAHQQDGQPDSSQ
ncbi:hypothetical protein GCM10009850_102910 [Nonomuraea monospora]|uniref:Uncharacterized protein n=1 Tax=Nonomuraea monospora TaxID=568818 RepID=A0ABP5PT18_9ACTN